MNPLVAAIAAGGFLLFNSQASPRKVEKKIEGTLRTSFPAARKIDVTVKGKRGLNVINGKFNELRIEMNGFRLEQPTTAPVQASAPPENAPTPPANSNRTAPESTTPTEETLIRSPDTVPPPPGPVSSPVTTRQPLSQPKPPPFSVASVVKARDRGHIEKTVLSFNDFVLGPLAVESFDAEFKSVNYDWATIKKGAVHIESAGAATARLILPASSLQTILSSRLSTITNPKLSLRDGLVYITGTRPAPLVGTPIPLTFTARPSARGREIWMEDVRLSLGGAPLPALAARSMLGDFNPVYTFDREGIWPYRVEIKQVTAQNERLTLQADLTFVPAVAPTGAPAVTSTGAKG
jgi:hypothetical protein